MYGVVTCLLTAMSLLAFLGAQISRPATSGVLALGRHAMLPPHIGTSRPTYFGCVLTVSFADVVRYDVHTTDVDAYLAASGPVAARFGERLPAGGILCQVARLAMPGLLVEIAVTAIR